MKQILFYITILILLLPALQKQSSFFSSPKLNGAYYPSPNIKLSTNRWFTTEFQNKKETYIKDHIGFRSNLIMLNNQLSYSLFRLAQTPNAVIGKNKYLYLDSYIYNYTGKNYIGDINILKKAKEIKFIQEQLKEKNITLLTAFLPSKASFYPEFIPNNYKTFPENNQKAYMAAFDSLNINYIDVNQYFQNIKDTVKYPLFPKNGLHWTSYGMAIGMDTVIKKIESMRGINIQNLTWEEPIVLESTNRLPDYDAENLLNLYFDLDRDPMPYPKFIYKSVPQYARPKTLFITDSYYWQAYSQKIPHHIFDWGGFWYYFKTLRFNDGKKEQKIDAENIDIRKQLIKQDIIVLFASQATLHLFPYGFENINLEENDSKSIISQDHTAIISYFKQIIKSNDKWSQEITKKANNNKLTYMQQLNIDAIYTAKEYLKTHDQKKLILFNTIEQIKHDSIWYRKIIEKANNNNISVDKQLELDAKWFNNKINNLF